MRRCLSASPLKTCGGSLMMEGGGDIKAGESPHPSPHPYPSHLLYTPTSLSHLVACSSVIAMVTCHYFISSRAMKVQAPGGRREHGSVYLCEVKSALCCCDCFFFSFPPLKERALFSLYKLDIEWQNNALLLTGK